MRLAKRVRKSLKMHLGKVRYFIEEIGKDTVAVACPALAVEYKGQQKEDNPFGNPRRGLGRLKKSVGISVCGGLHVREKTGAYGPVIINKAQGIKQKGGFPLMNAQELQNSTCWKKAQKGLKFKGAKMLAEDLLTAEDILGNKCKLTVLGLRGNSQI
jgi:hypothetical protein